MPFVIFQNGDMGVDMFFYLSGFLIAFILLKETEKYGNKIDILNFYRGRYLRLVGPLYFTLFMLMSDALIQDGPIFLLNFVFLNNLAYKTMWWTWSVAVEFQMYIISPFIVTLMIALERNVVKYFILLIVVVSTIVNFMVLNTFSDHPDNYGE